MRACTRGASGAGPSSSTGWRPPATPSPTPASAGGHAVRLGRRHHPQRLPRLRLRRDLRPGARLDRRPGLAASTPPVRLERWPSPTPALNPRRPVRRGARRRRRHDTEGLLRPGRRRRPQGRPGLAALPPHGRHQPDLLRPLCPPAHGPLRRHRGGLRTGQGEERRHGLANPYARYRKEVTVEEVLASPMVADPLRLLEICATSDGGAALVLSLHGVRPAPRWRRATAGHHRRRLHRHADASPTPSSRCRTSPPTPPSADRGGGDRCGSGLPSPRRPTPRPGIGPEDVSLAEVYDLSSALELDWYEDIGLCGEGEAEKLLRDGVTTLGGRVPVNPSGGLSCFGEAIPAQAIAQVCECVWQLRGTATGHQVEGARVAVTANQGLFGHGSSVLLSR